jgi:NAD(P)-dependent dehydrogenase (short-subunit alcohol dehydrogenase family)
MKVAVITGCSGGIGHALCAAFSEAGYQVLGVDRTATCDAAGTHVEIDLRSLAGEPADRDEALQRLRSAIGGAPVSVLVNNAAVQLLGDVDQLDVAAWNETLAVNVIAPFLLTQALLRDLEQARGSVVNIGSVHSVATKPGFTCYATSKAALSGLTRSLAIDLGGRVRVNAVCPAAVDTPMLRDGFHGDERKIAELAAFHPAGRLGEPIDVAKAALFLASDDAAFITGETLFVDGGIRARLHDPD